MPRRLSDVLLVMLALAPAAAIAAPVDAMLERYRAEARAADPAFGDFSAARGGQLYRQRFTGGKPDTPSCTACHGDDPTTAGRSLTGKAIEAVALSASPGRYADAAKVEKWFGRNCREVMGRDCTAVEKGDWLAYMKSR